MDQEPPRTWVFHTPGARHAAEAVSSVGRSPSWLVRAVVLTFLIVVGLPILVLLFLATLAAAFVFAIGYLAHRAIGKVRGIFGTGDGRENVRVIQRRES